MQRVPKILVFIIAAMNSMFGHAQDTVVTITCGTYTDFENSQIYIWGTTYNDDGNLQGGTLRAGDLDIGLGCGWIDDPMHICINITNNNPNEYDLKLVLVNSETFLLTDHVELFNRRFHLTSEGRCWPEL